MRFAKPWHRWTTVPAGPVVPAVVVGALLLAACGGSHPSSLKSSPTPSSVQPSGGASTSPSESPIPSERPVPAESNPPGDIPDNTQFVPYRSADGKFVVKVPEGWSRVTKSGSVSFTDKLNTVAVIWSPASSAPTVSSVKNDQVPTLRRTERAFTLGKVISCAPSCTIPYSTGPISVSLSAGNAVVVTYQENSAPNTVTGKQYRLEVVRFDFYRSGEEADLVLSGPVGSDNVDPWRLVAQS